MGQPPPRKLATRIGGKQRIVALDTDDGGVVRAQVEGGATAFEVLEVEPGLYLLRAGAEQTLAYVDGAGGKLTVDVRRPARDPLAVTVEVADARRTQQPAPARADVAATVPATVRSPIPGRVVKINVKPSDGVTLGQTLVVVEAMKMENELRAPRAGRVTNVHCAEGSAVEAGQDLVTIG